MGQDVSCSGPFSFSPLWIHTESYYLLYMQAHSFRLVSLLWRYCIRLFSGLPDELPLYCSKETTRVLFDRCLPPKHFLKSLTFFKPPFVYPYIRVHGLAVEGLPTSARLRYRSSAFLFTTRTDRTNAGLGGIPGLSHQFKTEPRNYEEIEHFLLPNKWATVDEHQNRKGSHVITLRLATLFTVFYGIKRKIRVPCKQNNTCNGWLKAQVKMETKRIRKGEVYAEEKRSGRE